MADVVLPPLEKLDKALPPIEQTAGAAKWAETFGEGDTNFRQRYYHNQDIITHRENLQRLHEVEVNRDLQTHKTAQDYFFRSKELQLKEVAGQAALAERQQRMEHAERKLPIDLAAREAAMRASMALETSRTNGDKLKADLEHHRAQDTLRFQEAISKSGLKPGTPAYAEALVKERLANPSMDHAYYDDLWKSTTGSKLDGDAAMDLYRNITGQLPGTAVTVNHGGVTIRQQKATDTALTQRLTRLESMRSKSNLDEDQKKYFDAEISATKAKMAGGARDSADSATSDTGSQPRTDATSTAPTTAAAPVSDAKSAPKTVWKMKDGVKWEFDADTKKPTGKYIKGQ